jgi:hypothetical protein
MLNYARQRAVEALQNTRRAVLVTNGPAGVQASECPCQAAGLAVYLLAPGTCDHLFNLEHDPRVTLLAEGWELKGEARTLAGPPDDLPGLDLLQEPAAAWSVLLRITPRQVQLRAPSGWGHVETIDLEP